MHIYGTICMLYRNVMLSAVEYQAASIQPTAVLQVLALLLLQLVLLLHQHWLPGGLYSGGWGAGEPGIWHWLRNTNNILCCGNHCFHCWSPVQAVCESACRGLSLYKNLQSAQRQAVLADICTRVPKWQGIKQPARFCWCLAVPSCASKHTYCTA